MKILLIPSNTGGHIYPAIAAAEAFKDKDPQSEILFVVGENTLGTRIIPKYGFNLKVIPTKRLSRSFSWQILLMPWILAVQAVHSFLILRSFKPSIIIAAGGFMALPLILTAKIFRIPVIILEQNVIPGLSNRLALLLADKMVTAFEESSRYTPRKTVLLGTPVRPDILREKRGSSILTFNLDPQRKTVLVLGGSQGARVLNSMLPEVAELLSQGHSFQFLHAVGERDYPQIELKVKNLGLTHYHLLPYLDKIGSALRVADVIVSRAGGSTLAEILCLGIPAILIPYPFAADNHQAYNARAIEKKGGAIVISETKLSAYNLASIIQPLLDNPNKLIQMRNAQLNLARPRAAEDIVGLAQSMVAERALIR